MGRLSSSITALLVLLLLALLLGSLSWLQLDSWQQLATDERFWQAVLFSLGSATGATLLALLLGTPTALWLARTQSSWRGLVALLLDIPLLLPPLLLGILLLKFCQLPWLQRHVDLIFSFPGALLAQFLVGLPLYIRSCSSALNLVNGRYEAMAQVLGATAGRAFWDTTWQLALPGIGSGLLLVWLRCLGEFGATLMVGGALPGVTENLPIYIYLQMNSGNFGLAIAACWGFVILVLALRWLWRRGTKAKPREGGLDAQLQ